MPSDLAAVKGLVLAMLARQPAGCAWLRFPAAPPLTSAALDGLPEGQVGSEEQGLADLSKEQHSEP